MARPRTDIQPRIVRAARNRFLLEGVDGASLRSIAHDARTSIGMVYYYFRTKEALFLAVVEDVYAKLLADLEQTLAPDAPIEERLRRTYRRVASMSEDEFTVIRMVVREIFISSKRRARLIERFSRGHLPLVLGAILDGVQQGRLKDSHHPAVLVISTATLAVFAQIIRRLAADQLPPELSVPSGEALAESLCDVLLYGIAKPGPV
jgi:TetR/AcrR family transcriptional regulator, upper aerobic nicotinate degradation pathway regulator